MSAADANSRDLQTDVVVVGGGGSGMMAACEARKRGCSVILLEKAERVGGTTALSVGSIMAAGSSLQKREGIQDSPAAHAEDLAAIAQKFGISDNAGLRRLFTEHSAEAAGLAQRAAGAQALDPVHAPEPADRRTDEARDETSARGACCVPSCSAISPPRSAPTAASAGRSPRASSRGATRRTRGPRGKRSDRTMNHFWTPIDRLLASLNDLFLKCPEIRR